MKRQKGWYRRYHERDHNAEQLKRLKSCSDLSADPDKQLKRQQIVQFALSMFQNIAGGREPAANPASFIITMELRGPGGDERMCHFRDRFSESFL